VGESQVSTRVRNAPTIIETVIAALSPLPETSPKMISAAADDSEKIW